MKWHYPVGLLYDLFSGASPVSSPPPKATPRPLVGSESSSNLPWRLVIHYSNFPADRLVRLDDDDRILHDAFINSVKEADFLRNGSAKAIMTMSKGDSTKLWESVRSRLS